MRASLFTSPQRILSLFALMAWALISGCSLSQAPRTEDITASGAPVVRIAAPLPNATYLEGVTVNVQALITNAGTDIERVDITVDNTVLESVTAPNTAGALSFSLTRPWTATGEGSHTVSVTAFRADGTSSAPASVTFTVVTSAGDEQADATPGQGNANITGGDSPTNAPETQPTAEPTQAPPTTAPDTQPTAEPTTAPDTQPTAEPTAAATTAPATGSGAPIARFTQGINVRSGPGTIFNPPIGSFAANQTAEILAVNPAGDWYKVRYYNGEGWVFSGLITVEGSTANLPIDPGPPAPTNTPPLPTVPPATAGPTTAPAGSSAADLIVGIIVLNPDPPVCNQAMEIALDIANIGTAPNANGGSIQVIDRQVAGGNEAGRTVGAFGVIQPGQTVRVTGIFLTVSTYFDEDHQLTITLDPENTVAEAVNNNNTGTKTYRLQRGACG